MYTHVWLVMDGDTVKGTYLDSYHADRHAESTGFTVVTLEITQFEDPRVTAYHEAKPSS